MSEKQVRLYETSGELNEKLYLDMMLDNIASSRERKVHMVITALLVLFCIASMAMVGLDWLMVCAIVLLLALELFFPYRLQRKGRLSFREAAKDGKICYATSFTDTDLHIENHTNGASADVPLASFKKVFSVDGVWALVSKAGYFYVVFANQLSETDRVSVLSLLKQHNPKLKISKLMNETVRKSN